MTIDRSFLSHEIPQLQPLAEHLQSLCEDGYYVNLGNCFGQSDGVDTARDAAEQCPQRGYIFAHMQDLESLRDGADGIYLAYGDVSDPDRTFDVGNVVAEHLYGHFDLIWDGSPETRIFVCLDGKDCLI